MPLLAASAFVCSEWRERGKHSKAFARANDYTLLSSPLSRIHTQNANLVHSAPVYVCECGEWESAGGRDNGKSGKRGGQYDLTC
mmetsp:Transcript_28675/g.73260  ORF Transcript_28675/g.73260 Transcript_28675/m.73260 type:complete len:84 (+) Transcript_28675:2577-2828(+)